MKRATKKTAVSATPLELVVVPVVATETDKVQATLSAEATLRQEIYKVFGEPLAIATEVRQNKNIRAYAVGFVLAAGGLKAKEWFKFVNLLDVVSSKDGFVKSVVKAVEGKAVVNELGRPYCESKHNHVFGEAPLKHDMWADAKDTVTLMRGEFGAELATAMGKATGVSVTPERLTQYLAEYETANFGKK